MRNKNLKINQVVNRRKSEKYRINSNKKKNLEKKSSEIKIKEGLGMWLSIYIIYTHITRTHTHITHITHITT